MTKLAIGVDISKRHLDAARFVDARRARFPNDAAGLAALKDWIGPADGVARLVYEATGPYHAGLEEAFAGWPLVRVNPFRATHSERGASPRPAARAPRPTRSTRRCWRGWAPSWICRPTRPCGSCRRCRPRATASPATAPP